MAAFLKHKRHTIHINVSFLKHKRYTIHIRVSLLKNERHIICINVSYLEEGGVCVCVEMVRGVLGMIWPEWICNSDLHNSVAQRSI